ncbi:hypothetical protein Pan44_55770 [Caulifigura coniformis]|uniref:Uncharacterized protein n=1 Tax=Caulifigura coniformis TaxID=2527983 RepID=A0A517SN07_9PLAN|nr:hypothetical protein [Caulifigura coniformis]QDT57508.1 hypothetical protein Pan44_55770 [Caulifigura coniformis]
MTRWTFLVAVILATTATRGFGQLPISPLRSAQLKSARNDLRRQNEQAQRLQQAERELAVQERQAIAEASAQVAAAKIAHRNAGKDLTKARDTAAQAIEQSLGLKAATEELARAQAAYRELSTPVLEILKASAEFQDAEKISAAAKTAIKELQADTSVDPMTKKSRLSDLVGESLTASNLERVTLKKDPRVNAARERLDAAQQKVADLRKTAAEKGEKDSSVAAAQEGVKSAHEAVQAAEANLAAVKRNGVVAAQLLQAGVVPPGADKGGKGPGKGEKKK